MLSPQEILSTIGFSKITPSGKIATKKFGTLSLDALRIKLLDNDIAMSKTQMDELVEAAHDEMKKKSESRHFQGLDPEFIKELDDKLRKVSPVLDYITGELKFYDSENRSLFDVHSKVFLAKSFLYESEKEMMAKAATGILDFYPLRSESVFPTQVNGQRTLAFNLYQTPKWVSLEPTTLEEPPKRIWDLLTNVFPDSPTLEYVLCWMYHAISSRNHVYLCLVGPRGVGKTMVADLVGQLVGKNYYEKADDSMLEEKFNSQLEKARLIFYDEVSVNDSDKLNKLKRFANASTAVQSKGKDTKTIKNYSSGILANNYLDGIQIGPEERRFSIVEIGKKDLRTVMEKSDIEELAQYLETDAGDEPHQDLVDFGHWLVNKFKKMPPEYSNNYTWRGEYYYKVSFSGLAQWKQFIIEYLLENPIEEPTLLKDLKTEYRKTIGENKAIFPASKTISNFLYDFRYRDGVIIGEMIRVKDHDSRLCPAIRLSPEFIELALKEVNEDSETLIKSTETNTVIKLEGKKIIEYKETEIDLDSEDDDDEEEVDGADLL